MNDMIQVVRVVRPLHMPLILDGIGSRDGDDFILLNLRVYGIDAFGVVTEDPAEPHSAEFSRFCLDVITDALHLCEENDSTGSTPSPSDGGSFT
jgi:hypothetical protein